MKKVTRIISWIIICFFSIITILGIAAGRTTDKTSNNDNNTNETKPEVEENTTSAVIDGVDNDTVGAPNTEPTTEPVPETETETSTEISTEPTTEKPNTDKTCVWGGFTITQEEYKLICTTVFCEAGGESLQTQILVCLTILNRYTAGYSDSIRGVIYAKNAYEVTGWKDFENRGWTDQVEQAVNIALEKNEHPRNMFYFRDDYFHKGSWAKDYIQSDNMYFSTKAN